MALKDNIEKYERQLGEITMPEDDGHIPPMMGGGPAAFA
jgi:hypothetical protein